MKSKKTKLKPHKIAKDSPSVDKWGYIDEYGVHQCYNTSFCYGCNKRFHDCNLHFPNAYLFYCSSQCYNKVKRLDNMKKKKKILKIISIEQLEKLKKDNLI